MVPVVVPFSELDSSEDDSDSDSSLKSDCSDSEADSSNTRVHNLIVYWISLRNVLQRLAKKQLIHFQCFSFEK